MNVTRRIARTTQQSAPASVDRRGRWTSALAVWLIILLMTVPMDFDYSGTGSGSEASALGRTLWLLALVVSWGVVLMRLRVTRQVLRETNIFFLAFLVLAVCSTLWSIDPSATIKRLPRLFIQFGAFLALAVAAWHARRFQSVVRPALTTLIAASLLFGFFYPELAIHQSTSYELMNAWHGLTTHKNGFGLVGTVATLLWLHALITEPRRRHSSLAGCAMSLSCVLLSRSSTCLVATLFSCATLILMLVTPTKMRAAVRFLAGALTVIILIYSLAILRIVPGLDLLLAPIPYITGKDLSFTGRADIWAVVVDHIRLRPLLGSGYGAYWVQGPPSPDMESYAVVGAMNGFYPGNSHNGYLDVLNDLGTVGLVCLMGYLILFMRHSLKLMRTDRAQGALFLVLLLQQAIINLSEARWFNNTIFVDFALMSFATTCLARALLDARQHKAAEQRVTAAPPGRFRIMR